MIFYPGIPLQESLNIYSVIRDSSGSNDTIHALRPSDGTEVWHYKADGEVAGLITDNHAVYFYTYGPAGSTGFASALQAFRPFSARAVSVYALCAKDGTLLWQYDTGSENVSLEVAHGVVYISATASSGASPITALRSNDGSQLWQHQVVLVPNETTILLVDVDNTAVYVGSLAGTVYALRTSDGNERWRFNTPVMAGWASESIAQADGEVYISVIPKGTASTIYVLRAGDGQLLRQQTDTIQSVTNRQQAADGKAYIISISASGDEVRVLRAHDGSVLGRYRKFSIGNSKFSIGNLLVTEERIYITSFDSISALKVSDGSLLWQRKFDNGQKLAVINNVVYVVSSYNVVCAIQGSDGSQIWCQKLAE